MSNSQGWVQLTLISLTSGETEVVEAALVEDKVWDIYGACAAVEGFDGLEHTEDELLAAWQCLVDTGVCWTLQGWYGRTAAALIEQGLISPA